MTGTNITIIMKTNQPLLVTFCLLLAGFISNSLSAQDIQSDVSGFYGDINVHYGQWDTDSPFLEGIREHDPNGWGLQLSGGYGFNQPNICFVPRNLHKALDIHNRPYRGDQSVKTLGP